MTVGIVVCRRRRSCGRTLTDSRTCEKTQSHYFFEDLLDGIGGGEKQGE
jgi:hypothetical protein